MKYDIDMGHYIYMRWDFFFQTEVTGIDQLLGFFLANI